MSHARMKFEDLLSEINGFGRFQKMVLCINFFGRFSLACHFLLGNFIAVIPSHHCSISSLDADEIFENLTQEERLTVSIPVQDDGTPASCHMFSYPQFHLLSNSSSPSEVAVVQCQNGWEYDNSTFISTLATQWDLVCDKRALSRLTTTIFFIGVMCGAAAFGSLSAMFGRKPMLLVSHMLGMGFGLCSAFSSSFIMFAVLRFFTGFTITGSVIISTILNVEWVSIEHRKLVGVIDSLSWTFAFMSFPLVAYFIRDWRWLTVAISLPTVTAIITWWWVPESARWLIANGRVDKAHYYLHKCAVMNRKKEIIVRNRKYSYLDLVRTPKMRKLALLTGITWFAVATVAYGISFNISSFGLNRYLTQFVQNGMGYNSFVARLGVSVAPLILLSDDVWSHFSQVILSSLGLSAAFVAYLLPETRGRCLPETIEDVEGIGEINKTQAEGSASVFIPNFSFNTGQKRCQ
uniref:Solute carrier family 22 member 7-like n=1 Tax=Sinocyclocheilus anshuiensis TaxID=1608454 RepID=A0A671MS86_9TELE